MFVAFLVQIVFRYFFNLPIGWTTELTLVTWLWHDTVGHGLRAQGKGRDPLRHLLLRGESENAPRDDSIVISIAIVALYGLSLPATWKYVTFMKVERSSYLNIRFDWLYSIYVLFMVGTIVRYLWLLWEALRGDGASRRPPRASTAP